MSSNWTPAQRAEVELRLGQNQNPTEIARAMGIRRESVRVYGKTLSQAVQTAANSNQKPKYRVPYVRGMAAGPANDANWQPPKGVVSSDTLSDEAIRVCVIGDLHVAPGQDLSRLKWIARHIGETQPDYIVQIGDWASFDSVSTHDPIGSIKSLKRPSLRQDIECLSDSLCLFDRELGPSTIPRLITLGNHETRVLRYEELRSELDGSVWTEVLQEFARHRWVTHDFGKVAFIGGVGFVHVPLNVIGKPHSSPNIMANNLTHDLIKGHSHRAQYLTYPKIGQDQGVTLIDVGTSLPHGHIESYAKLSQTGWYWGIHDVIIRNGRIDDFARISMKTLEGRYA